jgi:hypothetical protein
MRLPNQSVGVMYSRFTTPIRATGSGAVVAAGFFEDFFKAWQAKAKGANWLDGEILAPSKTNVRGYADEERVTDCLTQCLSAGGQHCDLTCCGSSGCNFN